MTRRINGDALESRDGTAVTGDVFVFDDAHVDGGEWEAPGAGSAAAAWPVGSIFLSAVSTNPATLLGFGTWSAIGAGRVLVGIDAGDADFDTVGETGGAKTTAHGHGYGTLATVAESSHTHAVGTLAVTDPGTGATYHTRRHDHEHLTVFAHTHPITGSNFAHQHSLTAIRGTTSGSASTGYGGITTSLDTSSTPTAALTTSANLPNGNTQPTGSATARTGEAREVGSATAWDTAHSVSGSTAAGSSHLHGVSGSTGSDSPSVVQPYLVVAMWQRTA